MKSELKKMPDDRQKNFVFESYGVKIQIRNDAEISGERIKKCLAESLTKEFKPVGAEDYEHFFVISGKNSIYALGKNEELIADNLNEKFLLDLLESRVRITVAEHAVGKVFLHAGVVSVGGKAIVIPAQSYQGKTTLVGELVRNGAVYYSDEYAVLDENGYVHPFPKMLSVRGLSDDYAQTDVPVEQFGGVAGTAPAPVAMILITGYKKGARWKPVTLSRGEGIMEILPHTIPIRNKPEFTLNVLNKVAERAIITKTMRAEADKAARLLISFFEKQAFKI